MVGPGEESVLCEFGSTGVVCTKTWLSICTKTWLSMVKSLNGEFVFTRGRSEASNHHHQVRQPLHGRPHLLVPGSGT